MMNSDRQNARAIWAGIKRELLKKDDLYGQISVNRKIIGHFSVKNLYSFEKRSNSLMHTFFIKSNFASNNYSFLK